MAQNPRFHELVADAKTRIQEISAADARQEQAQGAILIDVREAEDFKQQHAQGALHLSRGVLELKIEGIAPDTQSRIICYCGGGSRSALAADNLQKMGYKNVASMAGGFKAWKDQQLPTES